MRFTRWDQTCTTEQSNEILRNLAFSHLEYAQGPARDQIEALVRASDFRGLVHYDLDYGPLTAADAYHLGQVLAFYRKRLDLEVGVDRRRVAHDKFSAAEELCAATNRVFRLWASGEFFFSSDVNGKLFSARRKIASVLGSLPGISDIRLRFGPGATTNVCKRQASARFKLSSRLACSEDFIPLLPEVLGEMPAWIPFTEDSDVALVSVDIVPGRLSFVPKNAKTDRSIVVEPVLNSMVQLGIGDYIAARLKRVGIDISDQTRNQQLARIGSVTGALATLDLSSASDTVATGLVEHLLPPDWFDFLSAVRTSTVWDGERAWKLSKFSSMGNGFTFPLETLIFWALASVCTEEEDQKDVSVYGDDIIVPTYAYGPLCDLLQVCGFVVNLDKSFSFGPFRESCGKDYLSGIDIRPVFVKDRLQCADVFVLHNFYVRNGYTAQADYLASLIDPTIQLWGPDGYGDGHLVTYRDMVRSHPKRATHGWAGYIFDTFTWKKRRSIVALPGDYVFPSYSIYMSCESSPFDSREFLRRVKGLKHPSIDPESWGEHAAAVQSYTDRTSSAVYSTARGEALLVDTLPGVRGYKRISIYTLMPY